MAATYEVRVQYPTVEFLGGSATREVMAVGYATKPEGIYFEVRIPRNIYSAEIVRSYGIGYSGTVHEVAAIPGVTSMTWQQAPKPDGTLRDEFEVFVESDSGNSAGSIIVPFSGLAAGLVAPKVAALRAQLNDAEAS